MTRSALARPKDPRAGFAARLLAMLTLGAVTSLVLSGCTGRADGAAPLDATLSAEEISPPSWLVPQEQATLVSTIVPQAGAVPAIIVGAVEPSAGSGSTIGTVWAVRGDGGLDEQELPLPNGAFSPSAAGSEKLTVIVGRLWVDGVSTLQILTSVDRESWAPAAVDTRTAREYPFAAATAVGGDTGYAALVALDGRARGVRITDDSVVEFDLPEVDDGLLNPIALAARPDRLLLFARPGPEGDPAPPRAYVSDDGGRSWGEGVEIADAVGTSGVSGVTHAFDGFVATGSAPASSDPGAAHVPTAWSSPDGQTWRAETLPVMAADDYGVDSSTSIYVGAPVAWGDQVAAVSSNHRARVSAIYTRSSGGVWTQ